MRLAKANSAGTLCPQRRHWIRAAGTPGGKKGGGGAVIVRRAFRAHRECGSQSGAQLGGTRYVFDCGM